MNFKELHQQPTPLLLANVWDVESAKTAEKLNFQAMGTSSSAISSMLGYDDGEGMSFNELKAIVSKITQHVSIPLSVDLEAGYHQSPEIIANHIKQLVQLGVVGINLEDSIVDKNRTLLPADFFAKKITSVLEFLQKDSINIFLNIRTDTYLLATPDPLETTLQRIHLYEKAGADGIFVPCLIHENDMETITHSTKLPLNVMCMPNLPDFTQLTQLGVKRISMGNFLFDHMYQHLEQQLNTIQQNHSFQSIF